MKNSILILIALCWVFDVNAQNYINKKGEQHLWGKTTIEDFSSGEYEEWYKENSKDYITEISKLDAVYLEDINVQIFVGTWCGDTKFLVPKFIETWKQLGIGTGNLEIIALNNEGSNYKQGPNGETIDKNIHRVPTFIFSKGKKEIGRIVERTIFDLDTDITLIAKEQSYEERYQGATLLSQYLDEYAGDTLVSIQNFRDAMKLIRREISTSGELNAMGYVLMAQEEMEKAEFIFMLNKYLFPYDPNVIDSYGEFLFNTEEYEDSLKQYLEVIRLRGEDKNATAMITKNYEMLDEAK